MTLANLAKVHPAHLSSSFKRWLGVTVGDYVRHKRIEKASELLKAGDQPLGQISLDLGFADQSHFCRTFKLRTGLSPGEYRRLYKSASK